MKDDFPLIEASFLKEYKIRLRKIEDLSWDEFCTDLVGLSPECPLNRVVAIRSEKDPKVIAKMTPDERRIRNEWNQKMAAENSNNEELYKEMVAMRKAFFASLGQ